MKKSSLFALLAMLFTLSCDSDDPPPPPDPAISVVSAPEFLACNLDSMYLYKIRVENLDADSVVCIVTKPDNSAESFALFDDANTEEVDGPEWASITSHDQVGNNGVFTRGVRSDWLCDDGAGDYIFHFESRGGGSPLALPDVSVRLAAVTPCLITDVSDVNSLAECFDPITLTAQVLAGQEDQVDSVWLSLLQEQTILWQENLSENGSQWEMTVEPTLFRCVPTGSSYSLLYSAFTRYGFVCEERIENVSFTNSAPVLSNVQMPDTIYRPVTPGDCDTVVVTLDFSDCELDGHPFYYGTQFCVRREDAEQDSCNSSAFFLRDDGVEPDAAAGDGTMTVGLSFCQSDQSLNNLYYFKFFAVDCADHDTSNTLLDSVRVIQPGGLSNSSNPLGSSVFN